MRVQMNVCAHICGVLIGSMLVEDEVRVQDGVHPKIEPEIAFVTARELRGKISREEALAACSAVAPALEILDSRFIGFKYFSLPDVVADDCSSWRFALGPLRKPRDTGGLRMRMLVDGRVVQATDS